MKRLRVVPLVHDMNDLVDKPIQAHECAEAAGSLHARQQPGGGLFTKLFGLQHRNSQIIRRKRR